MAVPTATAVAAAWVYLDPILATKRNKEAYLGNAPQTLLYWAFWLAILIPLTILLASLVWKRLGSRRNRLVVIVFDVLLIAAALFAPQWILRIYWK